MSLFDYTKLSLASPLHRREQKDEMKTFTEFFRLYLIKNE